MPYSWLTKTVKNENLKEKCHRKGELYVSERSVTTAFLLSEDFFFSHTGKHAFVLQVEQYSTNSLSLVWVNCLCKQSTLQIDVFKQPRKEEDNQD